MLRTTLLSGAHTITRLRQEGDTHVELDLDSPGDGYVMLMALMPPRDYDLFVDGAHRRHVRDQPGRAGSLCLLNRTSAIRLHIDAPFDILQVGFSRRALEQAALEYNYPLPAHLHLPPGESHDTVLAALGSALLPSLEAPAQVNPRFVAHLASAMSAHLLHTYGGASTERHGGGLAPWQERRAKELLRASVTGHVSVAAIAASCRLSPGYFATAFKLSTGLSPTAWLAKQRVELARGMLACGTLTLSEIATATGFADQSHFTRIFTRLVGIPPGAWRRERGPGAPALAACADAQGESHSKPQRIVQDARPSHH